MQLDNLRTRLDDDDEGNHVTDENTNNGDTVSAGMMQHIRIDNTSAFVSLVSTRILP